MVQVGEEDDMWSFHDPRSRRAQEAIERTRWNGGNGVRSGDAGVLASIIGTLDYLLYGCPTTTEACAKLREMRRAVRELAEAETPPPGGTRE
jgi:hypothetical protein